MRIHDFDGEIIVNGKKVNRKNEIYKKDIAYIPDNPDVSALRNKNFS